MPSVRLASQARRRWDRLRPPVFSAAAATVAVAALLATGVTGCGSGSAPSAPGFGPAAVVVLSPPSSRILVGTTLPLQVEVQDASGQVIRNAAVFWSSSDTTRATVSSAGVVSARAVGTAQIAASSGGRSAVATVAILPVPVASVTVLPGTGSIQVGGTLALAAVTYDSAGGVLTGRQVLWASSAPQVATVDASGNVKGVSAGAATITATSEGKSGAAEVAVTSPAPPQVASIVVSPGAAIISKNATIDLTAQLYTADGVPITDRAVTWSSSDNGTITVTQTGDRTVTAKAKAKTGPVTVTAIADNARGSSTIVVTSG